MQVANPINFGTICAKELNRGVWWVPVLKVTYESAWRHIADATAHRMRQRTSWRRRKRAMVSGHGCICKGSRRTYFLEIERERNSVRSSTQMKRKTTYFLKVRMQRDSVRLWTRMQRGAGRLGCGGCSASLCTSELKDW